VSRSNRDYLLDLLRELADIAAFTSEGEAAFMSDIRTQKAVIRSYEVVGEICKRLPAELRTANPQIDWRTLIGFRDFLARNYDLLVLRTLWEAVEHLPALRAAVEALLAALPAGEDEH